MGNFQAGCFVPVNWKAAGANPLPDYFNLNIKEHSLTLQHLLHDVTGVKANGVRARIAGPQDIEGRVVLDLDLDELPFSNSVQVVSGRSGLMQFGVSPVYTIQVPVICEKVHFAGGTDKELMWDGDFKANSLAGAIVFPSL